MGWQTVPDCHRLRGHLLHLRLLDRLEKLGRACVLRRRRPGQLTDPDEFRDPRNTLAYSAPGSTWDTVGGDSGAGYPPDERSVVGSRVSCGTVIWGGSDLPVAITQSAHAA